MYPIKKLGQNFLIDNNIVNKIIASFELTKSDRVLEIGPGTGALTKQISKTVSNVTAVEIDTKLCKSLSNEVSCNTELINKDILKLNIEDLKINKIVGNLPYYITTPIIFKFLQSNIKWEKMFFLIQREVAQRIISGPGSKAYGRLSIMTQIYSEAKILFNVSPNCFYPIPKVESSLIQLSKLNKYNISNYKVFADLIRSVFNQRRKKLKNTLPKEILINNNIDKDLLDKRPEDIHIHEYVKLIN